MESRKLVVVYNSENGDMGTALGVLEGVVDDYDPTYIPRERLLERHTRNALVIVAGGDGTFLGASHRILDNYTVVLGVRLKLTSVGHYMNVDIHRLKKALPLILKGKEGKDYTIERLPRLECVMHTDSGNWVKTDENLLFTPPAVVVQCTPGLSNNPSTVLPKFPALRINEAQTRNVNGIQDGNGERDPWIELVNTSEK